MRASRPGSTAIILAGGASRRMGRDKAALDLGGITALQSVAETVGRVCDEVVIAAADRQRLDLPDVAWVTDPPGAAGPLAGLAAGLAAASHAAAIVVACDMPFLSRRLLAYLGDSLHGCDAIVPLIDGTPQTLHAAYSRDCLPTIDTLLRLGAHSIRQLLPRLRVRYLSESSCLELDPAGLSWFNMNTPQDYEFARAHWRIPVAEAAAA